MHHIWSSSYMICFSGSSKINSCSISHLTSWIQYLLWWEGLGKSLVSTFYILSSVSGCIQCNLVSWSTLHFSAQLRCSALCRLGWAGLGWAANPIISRHQTVILQCHFASLQTNQTINGSSEATPEVWRLKIDNWSQCAGDWRLGAHTCSHLLCFC